MAVSLQHLLVFVADADRVAAFYARALGLTAAPSAVTGLVHLHAAGQAVLALHPVPAEVIGEIAVPPVRREDAALKPCFQVDDLDASRAAVVVAGGLAAEAWAWNGRRFCDCADVEGNVFQIVAAAPT